MRALHKLLSISDFEREAKRRLPKAIFEYVRGGTEDEVALVGNRAVFDQLVFRARGLRNVSARSQSVTVLGQTYASPFGFAPTGVNAIVCHDCDSKLAREAAGSQLPYIISGASNVAIESLVKLAPHCWYQGYFPGDRTRIGNIADRLDAAGVKTIVVTIDTCVGANRENNQRNDFTIPFQLTSKLIGSGLMHPRWLLEVFAKTMFSTGTPRFVNMYETMGPSITENTTDGFRAGRDRLSWEDLKWLRDRWSGQLLVKGVMHPQDAELAAATGMDALIVSNHGGRQLDGAIAPLQALPDVVRSVPKTLPVLIDGGFRRGTDVLKAIALGAKLIFMGRPQLYGAAVAGTEGIAKVVDILRTEIDRDLALLGCKDLTEVTPDLLSVRGAPRLEQV
ncbi:MAG: alpha-hydroxy acid oxidase [Burkholderiaceae bacterium]|nr:alpha-hydroxy acid oxidase [Burkholderiaceae bacterium]